MAGAFIKHSTNILVVSGDSTFRQELLKLLRQSGYRSVKGCGSVEEALKLMATTTVGWAFIDHRNPDTKPNLFHLLRMGIMYQDLRPLRVSLVLDTEDMPILDQALDEGIMSWHLREEVFSPATYVTLFERIKKNEGDSCLIAASYVRDYLMEQQRYGELKRFESELLQIFPGKAELLGYLAIARVKDGDVNQAAATLNQVLLIDRTLFGWVNSIKDTYFDKTVDVKARLENNNVLGISGIVVIDPDEMATNAVKEAMETIGVNGITTFNDPREALEYLETASEPDIILQEWKLPYMSGPLVLQRIRQMGLGRVPILLMSSLVQDEDRAMLQEMSVQEVITKPVKDKNLIPRLIWTIQQERRTTHIKVFERKLKALLARKQFDQATRLRNTYMMDNPLTPPFLYQIDAEIYFGMGKLEKAKEYAIRAIKEGLNTVGIYQLTGRILMKLREFDTAAKCFEKAEKFSPGNVLRLCSMVESSAELNQGEDAEGLMSRLKKLDPRNRRVATTEANLSMSKGDFERAKKIMKDLENIDEVMAWLNNKGVVLAKQGKTEEAADFYKKAIGAIPANMEKELEAVHYNMALTKIREDKYAEAERILKGIKTKKNKRIEIKTKRMLTRIRRCMNSRSRIRLDTETENTGTAEVPLAELGINSPQPGSHCCHLIFRAAKEAPVYQPDSLPGFRNNLSIKDPGLLKKVS